MIKQCLAVSAISFMACNAVAQSNFTQLVLFGDSLLDTGNRIDLAPGIKFTNQKLDGSGFANIAPEYFAQYLNLDIAPAVSGGTNYAVGGYRTADIFESIVGNPVNTPNGGLRVPRTETVQRRPYLVENGGAVPSGALVLIDGGGNDLGFIVNPDRIAAVTASVTPGVIADVNAAIINGDIAPADAADEITARVTALINDDITNEVGASVGNLVGSVVALNSTGAQYIMLANVPNLAFTPGVQVGLASNALTQEQVDTIALLSGRFNDGVATAATLAAPGANIIPVDLDGALTFIMDNAESYGIANGDLGGVDQRFMCYNGDADGDGDIDCIEHPEYGISSSATPTDTSDPRRLIFNDALHPTEITSEIIGDYLIDIIAAPMKVGLLPELALSAARTQTSVAGDELRSSRWGNASGRLFVSGDVANDEYKDGVAPETDSKSLTVGRTFVASETLVYGAAITVGQQELDIDGADFDADSWGVTGMLGYRRSGAFIDAMVGLSALSYDDLKRDVKLGSQTLSAQGDTDGHAWTIDVLAGFDAWRSSDSWHVGPAVGMQYINTTVDGYTESGGAVSNYQWGEQRRKSWQWRYGLVASGELSKTFRVFGEVLGSHEQEDSAEHLLIRNTNLNFPSYQLPSYEVEDDSFVTATLGGSLDIMGGASLNLIYNYNDRGDGYEHIVFSYSMPM